MYGPLFDESHKIIKATPKDLIDGDKKRISVPSSGEYDQDILCQNCDNKIIGQYESYARPILYGGFNDSKKPIFQTFRNQNDIGLTECLNIDYKKFKLFLLSILWRASISKRPLFDKIDLDFDEEIIRKMIITGDAGEESDFPIFLIRISDPLFEKSIAPPRRSKDPKDRIFEFMIAGIQYMFYCAKDRTPALVLLATIKKNNRLLMAHMPRELILDQRKKAFGV